jgi:valyl-tRNA synthetase
VLQSESSSHGAQEAARTTLLEMLEALQRALHPFMPFITEELWAQTADARSHSLIAAEWPNYDGLGDAAAEAEMHWVVNLISQVRSVRAEMNVPPGAQIPLYLRNADDEVLARAARHDALIKRLARVTELSALNGDVPKGSVQDVLGTTTLVLPIGDVIDIAQERARLKKEMDKLEAEIGKIDAKLGNQSFVAKAPPEVVEEQRERRDAAAASQTKIGEALARLAD